MNCNGFKDVLFEYTEGSLAAAELEFAERHLLQCETCRKLVAREQNTSSRVSSLLQQASRDVRLNPEFEQQICCELGTGREKGIEGRKVFSGRRLWERVGGSRRVEDNPPYRGPVRWGASVPASRNWGWRLWAWASAATACLVMVLLIKTGSTTHDRQ